MEHRAHVGRRLRHLGLGVASVSLLMAALLPAAALAAPGEHDTFRVDETYEEDLCGLPDMSTHLEIKGNVHFLSDGTIIDNTQLRVTWSNDDGDWVAATVEGMTKVTETDNGDGTVTAGEHFVRPVAVAALVGRTALHGSWSHCLRNSHRPRRPERSGRRLGHLERGLFRRRAAPAVRERLHALLPGGSERARLAL